ncbi:MAG TPA: PorP/SprF family type IX secretion system membrane protein [Bacteroidia bacterium]|nr:PorP/SprF family type IX secretion system membrane protein [Bacteroidia bacterium]
MKKEAKQILLLLNLAFFSIALHAQDLHFSQFYESPLTLNPALCGQFNGSLLGEINYRTQWSSVMGASNGYNTMGATLELHNVLKYWTRGYLSQGLSFFSDRSGDAQIGTTQVSYTTACGIFLNSKSTLCSGLQIGLAQRSVNFQNMQWGEQYINGNYEANAPTGETGIGSDFEYFDFAGGVSYNYSSGLIDKTTNNDVKANFGVSVFHVNQPNISYYGANTPGSNLFIKYVFHGYLEYGINKTPVSIVPGFVYYMQGPSTELDAGISAKYYMIRQVGNSGGTNKEANNFELGIYYRMNDAVITTLSLKLKSYTMGISYDINTSQLNEVSSGRGAFELSIKYIK